MTERKKPVLYLDIDDVVLSFRGTEAALFGGVAARGASSFLRWAEQHFEIRPLTLWANETGTLSFDNAMELEQKTGMARTFWLSLKGKPFDQDKVHGIDWIEHEQGRDWVWLDDQMLPDDERYLRGRGCFENWVPCNTTRDPARLFTVRELLRKRFNLEN